MKWFTKLTTIMQHCKDIAAHVLAMEDRGVDVGAEIVAKAQAVNATLEKFIPEQAQAPTTTLIPVPDQHAATLGATQISGSVGTTAVPGGQQ